MSDEKKGININDMESVAGGAGGGSAYSCPKCDSHNVDVAMTVGVVKCHDCGWERSGPRCPNCGSDNVRIMGMGIAVECYDCGWKAFGR